MDVDRSIRVAVDTGDVTLGSEKSIPVKIFPYFLKEASVTCFTFIITVSYTHLTLPTN